MILGPATHAFAQFVGEPVTELAPVEVVATPIAEAIRVDGFGGISTLVGERQIRDLNAQDVPSALRRTPGVTISRYNAIGSFGGAEGGAVFIRGLGSSRPGGEVKTFIDGIPVFMGVFNHPLMDILPIDAAGSIEVVKGAQPHRFGNTFSAIDLVSKRLTEDGRLGRLQVAGGMYRTFVQTIDAGIKEGPFDAYLSQGFRRSAGAREDADGRTADVYGRLGYTMAPGWSVAGTLLYSDSKADDPGQEGRPETRQGRYTTESTLGIVTLGHEHDLAVGTLQFYWNAGEGDWTDQPAPSRDTLTNWDQYGLRLKETLTPWEGGELLLGFDVDRVTGTTKFIDTSDRRTAFDGPTFALDSPYLAVSHAWDLGSGWWLTPSAGLRGYWHNEFGKEWAPQAGLLIGNPQTEFHASYARGVNYPGLDVVVFSQNIIPALGESWRDLEAETLEHFELGASHAFSDRLHGSLTLFYDEGANRYVIDPPPPPPPRYANIGDFTIRGAELALMLNPHDDLALFAGLTLLDTDPADLPYAPGTSVSLGANWQVTPLVQVNVDAEYVSEMQALSQARRDGVSSTETVESAFLLNGRLAYRLKESGSGPGVELFLALENITDSDYEYRPGYPMPGITAMVGLMVGI